MHNIHDFELPWVKGYEARFNVKLFNAAVQLAVETTEANKSVTELIRTVSGLPWYRKVSATDYFESRDIRYFGELLERYAEKLGDTPENTRAIALAMAWTLPILTPNMLVGRQRDDFIRKLKLMGAEDVYISTAMYRLSDGIMRDKWRANLLVREYHHTEEVILALCSMVNPSADYDVFRPALVKLLSERRTLPVDGNAGIYSWLVSTCVDAIKACRKKDNAVPRALMALAKGYVREGTPPHTALMDAGYSPRDILYLNSTFMWDANLRWFGFSSNSIPAERMAVAFVKMTLASPVPQTEDTLDYVHWLASRYNHFEVKYEGNAGLWMAVCDGLKVTCPETVVWMCKKEYSFDHRFDVLDDRWDLLARELSDVKYEFLFRSQLEKCPDGTPERYRAMLDKYAQLTGKDYLSRFDLHGCEMHTSFAILVNAGIIDLWDFFEKHKEQPNTPYRYSSIEYVWRYAHEVKNRSSYEFWKRFFKEYTVRDIPKLFHENLFHDCFFSRSSSYWGNARHLSFRRDFLTREENRQLYEWIEASAFATAPADFSRRAVDFLESDDAAQCYEVDELRPIFNVLIADDPKSAVLCQMKKRFMSETELEAERLDRESKERAYKLAQAEAQRKKIFEEMETAFDGSLKSILKSMDKWRYYRSEQVYSAQNAMDLLERALKGRKSLDREEYRVLLKLLSVIVSCTDVDDGYVRGIIDTMTLEKEEREAC